MRLLLDTVALLWIDSGDPRVSRLARQCFVDPANELFFSAVSAWEIAIKYSLGRLPLPCLPADFVAAKIRAYKVSPLPLDEESALYLARLPRLHSDPFDRMLVCQSIVHGLAILSPDALISQYPVRVRW
ncbi:MAG: type II toxin-antitoxin system VapC family toxin [Bryobacteraceae bacterium]